MRVYLVTTEADVYEQRQWRILAVKRTKTAAATMRRDHNRQVRAHITPHPRYPASVRDLATYVEAKLQWEAEAELAAKELAPDLPWQLWATPWRVEEHEVEG